MSERVNLIETIGSIDKFSTFARMLRTTQAIEILKGSGPFTVFVPTNDAFGKIPDPKMNAWLSESEQKRLKSVLLYHIVPGKLFAANLEGTRTAEAMSGQEVNFTDKGALRINASILQARNLEATNGMVHAIDTVLTPPAAAVANPVVAFPTPTMPEVPPPHITAQIPVAGVAPAPVQPEIPSVMPMFAPQETQPVDTRMATHDESLATSKLPELSKVIRL